MRIAIGILARNESERIFNVLDSLFRQTIFAPSVVSKLKIEHIQVVCVPNGCTDQTVERVGQFFDLQQDLPAVAREIYEIKLAGKSRSWNEFVHAASDATAKYIVFLDADIEFGTCNVIEGLIAQLETDPQAMVVTDRPIKKSNKQQDRTMRQSISLSASEQNDTSNAISGQLYCGRSVELRRIWMPLALPVEDGFLAAMVSTNGFTLSQRPGSIVRAADVFHYYDDHSSLAGFLRHESRIVVGSVINAWLFQVLWEKGRDGHVGSFIKDQNELNPEWLDDIIAEQARSKIWAVPLPFLMKRLAPLRARPFFEKIRMMPIALFGTLLEFRACMLANKVLRRKGSSHFW